MNESDFLTALHQRAKEQEKIMKGMLLPGIFTAVSMWLGNHPWRILIPVAFILSLLFRNVLGTDYTDFILKLFRTL